MKKLLVIFLLFLCCSYANSQISISAKRDLNFGSILPGVNKTITTTVSSCGRFTLLCNATKTYSVTFTLPSYMTTGSNNVPVTFTATKSTSSSDATPGTSFDPYTGTSIDFILTTRKNWYIRLGGTASPSSNQVASTAYQATVLIILSLTSN